MKRGALLFVLLLSCTMLFAQDSLHTDTLKKAREIGVIRETIRGFDRLEDDYIEPNHYEFTVMAQVTRTFENFILSSNGQSIRLAPDSQTKIGPYFGWRWFFFGYTFDIKNIGFNQNGLRKEFDISIYSSQIGVDLFYRRTGNDYKIRDVKLGYQPRTLLLSRRLRAIHLSENQLRLLACRRWLHPQHARYGLR